MIFSFVAFLVGIVFFFLSLWSVVRTGKRLVSQKSPTTEDLAVFYRGSISNSIYLLMSIGLMLMSIGFKIFA
ncbi:MAG: hypothetical protein AAB864_00315 [Patescibacteria group bacterium]